MSGGRNAPVRDRPTVAQLEAELARTKYRARYRTVLRSTVYTLVIVVAAAVLVATLWLPVLQIYGNSMTPTLADGDIVVSVKQSDFAQGDVVAFYYNNKILIKRVIAGPGDWVDVKEDGTVFVNGAELNEPYLEEKAFGGCDIDLPYQVPDRRIFVMGDHRSVSVDFRNTAVGCVAQEQIVGRMVFRVWPLKTMGSISLTGAEFTLEKYNKATDKWETITVVKNDDGTTFTFSGLDDGNYRLTETTTPDGYNTIAPIEFTITAEHDVLSDSPTLTSLSGDVTTGEITFAANATDGSLSADVINNAGATLPETGGMGTTIFCVLGGVLMLGAVVLLVTKKRMNAE